MWYVGAVHVSTFMTGVQCSRNWRCLYSLYVHMCTSPSCPSIYGTENTDHCSRVRMCVVTIMGTESNCLPLSSLQFAISHILGGGATQAAQHTRTRACQCCGLCGQGSPVRALFKQYTYAVQLLCGTMGTPGRRRGRRASRRQVSTYRSTRR